MTTIYEKNKHFAKYGHVCRMENELDELPNVIVGNSLLARFRRKFVRFRMVSETSLRSNCHLRSQGAIANEKHMHLKTYYYMLHPFSDARQWWELVMCAVFLIQFLLVPFDVALFRAPHDYVVKHLRWKQIRVFLDVWCFLDIIMNFFTGYFNMQLKQAELSPFKVAINYWSETFIYDILSAIPSHLEIFFEMDTQGNLYLVLQLLSLLRLLRFITFIKYCNVFRENYQIHFAAYKTVMIVTITFLYFHLVTCCLMLWNVYTMGLLYNYNSTLNTSVPFDYRAMCYKSLLIIRSVGFGDSHQEEHLMGLLIIVCFWIISRLLLILIIGKIMHILKATTSSRHKYVEMVRQLKQYMYHRQLPEYMQRRILKYYEFRFQKRYFRESEILSTISGQLRQEIIMHSCRKLVENVAFFKNIPFALLARIVTCLRSEIFLANDVIVRAATAGNSMFFIASGTVAVFTASGREICHLEDGAHFGEIALVMRDELRVASVVAVDACELYRLDRQEFVRAIHPYPDLLDNIQRIATDRMERTTMLDEHDRREMATKRLY